MSMIDINASVFVRQALHYLRRILAAYRIDRIRRKTRRRLNSFPGIVRRDVGAAYAVQINRNELSHQFYSLD